MQVLPAPGVKHETRNPWRKLRRRGAAGKSGPRTAAPAARKSSRLFPETRLAALWIWVRG
ncbi:MAG: hypothetical protein ABSC18_12870 [Verrucomicrobiota bacterium]